VSKSRAPGGPRRQRELSKQIKGVKESQSSFCNLRPEGPIAGGAVLGEGQIAPSPPESEFGGALSRVQGEALATQRLFRALRSRDSLFCCVVKGKQLQKYLNLAARGLCQPSWKARNYMQEVGKLGIQFNTMRNILHACKQLMCSQKNLIHRTTTEKKR